MSTYLIPTGSLAEAALVTQLRTELERCVEAGEYQVVIDLARVPLVQSPALELLLEAQENLARYAGALRISNPNAVVQDILRITGLSERVGLVTAEVEARQTVPSADRPGHRRIGEILVSRGLVTEEIIGQALELQKETGRRMAEILVEKGWVEEEDFLKALGEQLGIPFVWLRAGLYDPEVVQLVDRDIAHRLKVMPLFRLQGVIYLATTDPQSMPSLETVQDLTGCQVSPVLARSDEILKLVEEVGAVVADLSEFMGDLENDLEIVENSAADDAVIDQMASGSPVINLINGLIQRAVRDGASDIHIEPSRGRCRVRLRIDGALYTVMSPPLEAHPAMVSRLKVMAGLDIAERRLPQDGRIQVSTLGRIVDLRFSSLPGIFGEKIVLRVLDKAQGVLDLDRLGLSEGNRALFEKILGRTYGLMLVTGPTGSGKTTTLYAGLDHLNRDDRNIVTIEDPVEYQVDTLNQNQVRENIGLSFARLLKHVLRQDPDIIMVGEIRERETAEIAIQAALTGHLVLSTLHTNDSLGAITRMLDMGIEPYLLSSAIAGVMAQRLVRTICPDCTSVHLVKSEELEPYGVKVEGRVRLARGRGCSACYDSGYKGRRAIHEVVEASPDLERLIASNPARSDLDAYIAARGFDTMLRDGMERVLAHETTLEEVLRAVRI